MTPAVHDLSVVQSFVAAPGQTNFAMPCMLYASYEGAWVVKVDGVLQVFSTIPGAGQFTCTSSGPEGCIIHLGTPCIGNEKVVVTRDLPLERVVEFIETGPVAMASLNLDMNRIVSMLQDMKARFKRVLMTDVGDLVNLLPNALARAGKLLSFDLNGQPVVIDMPDTGIGDKGDPGGNVLSVGLFTQLPTLNIPVGTDVIQTSGSRWVGIGADKYVADPALVDADVAAHPWTMVKTLNGRFFRILADSLFGISVFTCGAQDATGTPKMGSEVVYDCSDNIDAVKTYSAWLHANRGQLAPMNFASARGLGCTRSVIFETSNVEAPWNKATFNIWPGRFVAMNRLVNLVELRHGNYQCAGQWLLYGGTDTYLNGGDYSTRLIENGMLCYGIGDSNVGDLIVQGAQRWGLTFDHEESPENNNIYASFGQCVFLQCGTRNTDIVKWAGVYSSGSWVNHPADNGLSSQRHRMVLNSGTIDAHLLRFGDMIDFGVPGARHPTETVGVVKEINAYPSANSVDINVWPYQPVENGGNYLVIMGGGVDAWGPNLANVTFESIQTYSCAVGMRYCSLFAPTIKGTFLTEATMVDVQIGGFGGESMQGIKIPHYHMENNLWGVIDYGFSEGTTFEVASSLPGDVYGKLSGCQRLASAAIIGGVFMTGQPVTMSGITFKWNGGEVAMPGEVSGKGRDLGGITNHGAMIGGNLPSRKAPGPVFTVSGFTIALEVDASVADKSVWDRKWSIDVYGTGPGNAPTEVIAVTPIYYQPGCTVNGGAIVNVPVGVGAVRIICTYEPAADGSNTGNWFVMWERITSDYVAPVPSVFHGISTMPIDLRTLGGYCYFEVADLASMFQDNAATLAAAVGSPVMRVNDRSGSFNYIYQPENDPTHAPILVKIGPYYFLKFDGVNDWLATAPFAGGSPQTLISGWLLQDKVGSPTQVMHYGTTAIAALEALPGTGPGTGFLGYAGANLWGGHFDGRFHIHTLELNGATSNNYVDDDLVATGASGGGNWNGFTVGASNVPNGFAKGLWSGALLSPLLSAANRDGAKQWLGLLSAK